MTTRIPLVRVSGKIVDLPATDVIAGAPAGPVGATGPTGPTGATGATGATGSGGSATVFLEAHTASSSSSLNFTTAISSTYEQYVIELVGVVPATNAVQLQMRMSTNGGSSYDSGTNYSYNVSGLNRFGLGQTGVDSGGSSILLNKSAADNTATAGINGTLRLFSPSSTSLHKNVQGQVNILTGGVLESQIVVGFYRSTTAVDAFQFLFSSGSIASGTIRVYGITKS